MTTALSGTTEALRSIERTRAAFGRMTADLMPPSTSTRCRVLSGEVSPMTRHFFCPSLLNGRALPIGRVAPLLPRWAGRP